MSASLFINLDGEPIPENEVLGYGRSGVVILHGDVAVKTPFKAPWSPKTDVEVNTDVTQREQDVYRRLSPAVDNQLDSVVYYVQLSPKATHLAYMKTGISPPTWRQTINRLSRSRSHGFAKWPEPSSRSMTGVSLSPISRAATSSLIPTYP